MFIYFPVFSGGPPLDDTTGIPGLRPGYPPYTPGLLKGKKVKSGKIDKKITADYPVWVNSKERGCELSVLSCL